MKKYLFCILGAVLLGAVNVSAQNETVVDASRTGSGTRVFKVYNNPTQDKTDQFDIQSIGSTTFTASNTADGTTNSFKHSLQVVVNLVPNKAGNNTFQLIFYSPNENIQQAATYTDGTLNIYYPVALYEDIRGKLEQSFASKKKVTVKVTQKTNGYREGTLIL